MLGKTGEFDNSVALDLPRHRLLEPALRRLKADRGERERLFSFSYTDFLQVYADEIYQPCTQADIAPVLQCFA